MYLKIISLITFYLIFTSIGCQSGAIITSWGLDMVSIDSTIGISKVEDKFYGHYFIIVNDQPYEPRFLGLYLKDTINYNEPYKTYTASELYEQRGLSGDLIPILTKIINE